MEQVEIWKDVIGFEGIYQVSNLGRVKSLKRTKKDTIGRVREYPEIVLKQMLSEKGYLQVNLYILSRNVPQRVARVVAQSFIPNPENKSQVNHINGIKTDNRVENLEWNTSLENIRHSIVNNIKKTARGEQSGASKFKDEDIRYIRESNKIKYHLAKEYNVCITTITNIKNKITWKHI